MNQQDSLNPAIASFPIRHILFLQQAEALEKQRQQVSDFLSKEFPDVEITFSSDLKSVPQGATFDVVIAPTLQWLPDALRRLSDYHWIHFLSAGVEKIWQMDFDKSHAILTKSSGVHGAPMSEYAIGAMLYFTKQLGAFYQQSRQCEWRRTWLDELTDKQLTILGLGHVGASLARRAKAFDMRVVGTLRSQRCVEYVDRVIPPAELDEELARTDFLAVCLPLVNDTQGLVDDIFLSKLQRGSVLVDISRGGVVKGDAVLRALDKGVLKGAALDVFEEQPLPKNSPLWKRDDILITPHVSGTTPYYLERALKIFLDNARARELGLPLKTPVNIKNGY